jgi:predicted Zn-dependent peptidase
MRTVPVLLLLAAALLLPLRAAAEEDYLQRFESKVSEFTLENGMRFLIIERHQAPVASFVTFVDVGSVDEPRGHTGIAHIFEHMAFKGTQRIGTTDWEQEKRLLERIDTAYADWLREKYSREPDRRRLEALRSSFEKLQQRAQKYVVPNEFSRIIERNGGTNLNAGTSKDYTIYFCSLPSNRAELWFTLESQRLRNPVFREFYTEKEVVLEERRMRVDSNPTGRLIEELLAQAYIAHPYGNPTIGWHTDIVTTTRDDLRSFYERFYVPRNMTVAIAGDVDPKRMKELARTYFGPFEARERSRRFITREPEQRGERRFRMVGPNQPLYVRAYHTVDALHEDAPALELLGDIMARGRTSRMYRELVAEKGLAAQVQAFNGFPGEKYPALFVIFGVPNRGVTPERLAEGIQGQIDALRKQGIEPAELQRARTKIRADLIRGLNSNMGLARRFAKAQALRGDWRRMFTYLDRLERVSPEDVAEAAQKYLQRSNRCVGEMVLNDKPEGAQ